MANETWYGGKPKVDAGGTRPGQAKPVRQENTERYECLRCDTTQIETKSSKRNAKQIRCRNCGNMAYPVAAKPADKTTAKFCKVCNAKLRAGNGTSLCSLCDR